VSQSCLIVGAGPVGLTLACLLSKYEIPYRIIDKSPQPVMQTKAAGLWARTLEAFHHLGLAESFLEAAHRSYSGHVFSGGQERVHLDLSKIASHYNFVTLIPQHQTEAFLSEHLSRQGVKVERGVKLVALAGQSATLEPVAGGDSSTQDYRFIFGCDGAHSQVRKEIGATFEGAKLDGFWMVGDMRAEGDGLAVDEVSMFLGPEGPLALFALGQGRYRVVASSDEPLDPVTLDFFQKAAEARVPFALTFSDPNHLQMFVINERQASSYSNGVAFLLGDAAHIHSPAGGQGVNTGIQDAFNLAWKVAQVIKWGSTADLLSSYQAERYPIARRVIEASSLAIRMVGLKNPLAQKVRSAAMGVVGNLEPVAARIRAGLSQIDIHYPDSPLNLGRGTRALKPGDRVPDVFWWDTKSRLHRLHDQFTGFHWTLLSGEEPWALPEISSSWLRQVVITRLGDSHPTRLSDPAGAVRREIGLESGEHLLVRPDGYMAGALASDQRAELLSYWRRHCQAAT
jgi:2-polyprenyl-6-methoxyphenol hydroxylase-like FAD-dependent oxidoreductase